ncbi:hypothetical protein ACFXKY_00710 [Streptomyces canus]|uniref:hypothetical protein n=1 Tax=Streptomyces canus TaxID=58343 RepID=UPI0036CDF4A6
MTALLPEVWAPPQPYAVRGAELCGRGNEQVAEVIDYSVGYLPLSFDCETTGGGSYTAEVIPAYVNPAAVGLALAAVGCAVSCAYVSELRLRAEAREGGAG